MNKLIMGAIGVIFCTFAVGCASNVSLEQTLSTRDRAALEEAEFVELPSGYKVDNFQPLKLGVVVKDMPAASGVKAKELPDFVKKKIEGDVVKLSRFIVVPLADEDGKMALADISDVDPNFKLKEQVRPNELDLVVTFMAQRTTSSYDQQDGWYTYVYTVDGQIACRDLRTGVALFSETVKGQSKEKTYKRDGQIASGFNYRDVDAVNGALVRASKRALVVMFSKLGNMFPVGGQIVKCDRYGEMLTLDKGTDDGVGFKGHQFTIVVDDEGQNVPLCYAEAQAGKRESVLKPYRWNEDDRAAVDLKKEFLAKPREFIKKYRVYAAGHGLAVPPDWDVDGEKKELNDIIER